MTTTAGKRTVRCEHCGHPNRIPAAARGRPRCGHCHQSLPWIVDAGEHDFTEVAERATLPVLVDMWAPWCGPCRLVSPALEQLAREFAGRLKLVKVNVDSSPALSARFTVKAVPTLMVLDGSDVVARQAGAMPVPALRQWVERALAGQPSSSGQSTGSER
jgi:thioredoxin 2